MVAGWWWVVVVVVGVDVIGGSEGNHVVDHVH
jgi:hypothetical protein